MCMLWVPANRPQSRAARPEAAAAPEAYLTKTYRDVLNMHVPRETVVRQLSVWLRTRCEGSALVRKLCRELNTRPTCTCTRRTIQTSQNMIKYAQVYVSGRPVPVLVLGSERPNTQALTKSNASHSKAHRTHAPHSCYTKEHVLLMQVVTWFWSLTFAWLVLSNCSSNVPPFVVYVPDTGAFSARKKPLSASSIN